MVRQTYDAPSLVTNQSARANGTQRPTATARTSTSLGSRSIRWSVAGAVDWVRTIAANLPGCESRGWPFSRREKATRDPLGVSRRLHEPREVPQICPQKIRLETARDQRRLFGGIRGQQRRPEPERRPRQHVDGAIADHPGGTD